MTTPKKRIAPRAKDRYNNGTYGTIPNSNAYLNYSFGYAGYPRLTDYFVVVGNDRGFIQDPSRIGKGYDYYKNDSVAIEIPSHMPWVSTPEPVYQSNNPEEFQRLSRRVDEAKSVSKPAKKQAGGQLNMNDQQLQQAFIQFLAQKTGAKTQQELEAVIQQLGEEGLKQAYAEFMQMMQQQQVQAAKFGAKLNYIKKLRGNCPDGYEMMYYKSGGRLCKKCMQKQAMQDGGELPDNPIDAFKCGSKMKKKKADGGNIELDKCGKKMKKKECGGTMSKKWTPKNK